MNIVFILFFTVMVDGVGPVTTRTEFASLDNCMAEKHERTMSAGDHMMRAYCEPVQK
jgi:hypothetical protein